MKKNNIVIVLSILLVLVLVFFYFSNKEDKLHSKCLGFTTYDPWAKVWSWKITGLGEYYETRDQAIEACMSKLKELDIY